MKKINIITGHYGSGKTNVSANLAIKLADLGNKVTVVDLDIVNPYFRTADFAELFKGHKIELVKSMYANSNLDIPAISFDLERIATDDGYLIIDVGGDDDGATALGRYAEAFRQFVDDTEFFYVVNCFRYLTHEPSEAVELLYAIEGTSRMKATAIINNSNLGCETTKEHILNSIPYAEEISRAVNLPIAFTTAPSTIACAELDGKVEYVDIYVKQIWDQGYLNRLVGSSPNKYKMVFTNRGDEIYGKDDG